MTDDDKAALLKLYGMGIGSPAERYWLEWLAAVIDRFNMTTAEQDIIHRLLQKYGPQLGL